MQQMTFLKCAASRCSKAASGKSKYCSDACRVWACRHGETRRQSTAVHVTGVTDVTVEAQNVTLERRIDALQQQLERLEQQLLSNGHVPVMRSAAADVSLMDGMDLEIRQAAASADVNPNYNFLIASALQVYGTTDGLPAEVIDYGIRTGKIKGASGSPKAMVVPQFEAPTFDDLVCYEGCSAP